MSKNNILEFSITTLTEIYNKKKPELIDICISQNLKSTGTVRELRARLSKYFKGNIELDDIRETLTEREKQAVINISVENRIKIEGIELEENSEEENDYYNLKTKEEVEKSKQLYENINTKAQDITNTIEKIINNDKNQYINNSDNIYESLNFNEQNTEGNSSDNFDRFNILNKSFHNKDKNIKKSPENSEKENNLNTLKISNNTCENHITSDNKKNKEVKRNLQMTPDYFTGNEDVKKFLKQYSMITDFNNWDEKDKLKFLPMFVKGTASNFLDNLNNLKTNWTWKEIEDAFIDQYLPIDYTTILKTNLENRRQGESESATSFMTEIEKNLKKYELMQHRINNRGPTINNYTDLLNLQVTKLQEFHKNKEIKKNEEHTENLLLKIEQLTEEVKRMNMLGKNTNRSVDFRENRYYDDYEDKSYYRNNETRGRDYNRNKDYYRKPEYRYKSPYPGRSRESSRDSRRYNRNRSFSRDNQRRNRDRSYSRERPDSREQSYTRESQRDNYKRQDSRDRQSRSRTPEQYRNKDKQKEMRGEMENITCYKCERRGHYATQCDNVKN
ncbi:uncharacterized protein DDB_G0287625-like [Aphis gossypii]|uniref:uncharacterized protein DDB_G0287625-like n=1 Tax=Aphis gossypii TaxID=80765 RepID=UPI0021595D37|nr:uncharacterized protein DDB_G0287625-like [Aphis gossypii]